eukprot:352220-Pleurochrysis_carterae.AAC.1
MPNTTVSHLDFATYHIDAALIDANRTRPCPPLHSRPDASKYVTVDECDAKAPVSTHATASELTTSGNVRPPALDASDTCELDQKVTRNACIDLRNASNARALVATRSARLSDKHTRGLRATGKHI